jgi:hypothetical protein
MHPVPAVSEGLEDYDPRLIERGLGGLDDAPEGSVGVLEVRVLGVLRRISHFALSDQKGRRD